MFALWKVSTAQVKRTVGEGNLQKNLLVRRRGKGGEMSGFNSMCDSRPPDKEEESALRDGEWHTAQLAGTYLVYKEKP